MNNSPLIVAIQDRLRVAHYFDLPTPLRAAGVDFDFTGAMLGRGGRALDLVLLIDTTTGNFGDRDSTRVRQRIEALSRALDVTSSRLVVTAILAGAALAESIGALSETCRVLQVESATLDNNGKPVSDAAQQYLDDSIRVLLPLTLPSFISEDQDGGDPAMDQLTRALPSGINRTLVEAVIAASSTGEQAVTEAASQLINHSLQPEHKGDRS